jgi:ABC-type antimicrobial peptide transport system permease subunit
VAFILVVGLLMVMLAFVNGVTRLADGSAFPGNVIVLSTGATDELMSNLTFSDASEVETQPGILHDDQGRTLCSREVYVVVNQGVPAPDGTGERRRMMQLRGIEDPLVSAEVHGITLEHGGAWFSSAGVRERAGLAGATSLAAIEAVVGEGIARQWGLEVGEEFDVGPRRWVVIGVMKAIGSNFGSEIWAKRQIVGGLFGKENIYTSLVLRTSDQARARQVAEDLTSNLKKVSLRAMPEKEYYSTLASTNQGLLGATYVVAIVMAVGGIFGVMNTMFAAISQRSRDIGVLRIIGFARWQILTSFLLESLLLALVGGSIGCALGLLANGFTAMSLLNGRSLVFSLTVDAETIAVGMLFTLSMGGLGGLVPAVSAMRISPLATLR